MGFPSAIYLSIAILIVARFDSTFSSGVKKNPCGRVTFLVCPTEKGEEACPAEVINLPDLFEQIKNSSGSGDYVDKLSIIPPHSVAKLGSISTSPGCRLSICEDEALMGNCFHLGPNSEAVNDDARFQASLNSNQFLKSALCTCEPADGSKLWKSIREEDAHFDRNLVGVVYSPYDKHFWVEGGVAGDQLNYTDEDVRSSLSQVATKFTYISTLYYDVTNVKPVLSLVPKLAAEINKELGFLALRLSVGVYIEDIQVLLELNPVKVANNIFPGTVWGIALNEVEVYSDSVVEATLKTVEDLKVLRDDEEEEWQQFKIGVHFSPLNTRQVNLEAQERNIPRVAPKVEYMLVTHDPENWLNVKPFQEMISVKQGNITDLRRVLLDANPDLKLIFTTGQPSAGVGNGREDNSAKDLRDYWYKMSEYGKENGILFHMNEAIDEPWRCKVNDFSSAAEFSDVGPNGTTCRFGWWYRANNKNNNNSEPPVYIEKAGEVTEEEDYDYDGENSFWDGIPNFVKISMGAGLGVTLLTLACAGNSWRRFAKAKNSFGISRAYIEQFRTGEGDEDISALDRDYFVALRMPYDNRYELRKGTFSIDKTGIIGSGQSGIVVRGEIGGILEPVAFKCTMACSSVMDVKNLMSEIKILSYIGTHENIVCLLGAYTKKIEKGIIYVALQYCELGSLDTFLRKLNPSDIQRSCGVRVPSETSMRPANYILAFPPLELIEKSEEVANSTEGPPPKDVDFVKTFLSWCFQIASAMEFVSEKKVSREEEVVHADLAARNILLSSTSQVKISDFGLSRKLYYQEVGVVHDKDTPLPWRWMAPESLKNLVFSVESDVWMYGVLIWEIFSLGEVPYHGTSYDMQFAEELIKGMRLPRAKFSSEVIHRQLLECWTLSPLNRPSFTKLKNIFQMLHEESEIN